LAAVDLSGSRATLLHAECKEAAPSKPIDKEFIRSALAEFITRPQVPKQVQLVLSPPLVQLERVELPHMPAKEVTEAIRWKIKDRLRVPLADSLLDFYIADEYTADDESKHMVVTVAVVPKVEVDNLVAVMQELHLNVVGISVSPGSLGSLLKYTKSSKPEETVAWVELGAEHAQVSIYKNYKLLFARRLPISSNKLTDAMCGVLVSDKGKIELSREDAEAIKRKHGLPLGQKEMLDDKVPATQIVAMVRPILEQLATEIKRTCNFYLTELKGELPVRVYLSGGGSRLKNLELFLQEDTGLQFKSLDLLAQLDNRTKEDNVSLRSFYGIFGAILPASGKEINLIPPELAAKKLETIEKISIRMLELAVIAVLVVLFIGVKMRVGGFENRLKSAKSHLRSLREIKELFDEFTHFKNALITIQENSLPGELLLKEISNLVPTNIVLYELDIGGNARDANFKGILYHRSAIVEDELTSFMELLEGSGFFSNAYLVSVQKEEIDDKTVADFEIRCGLSEALGNVRVGQGWDVERSPQIKESVEMIKEQWEKINE